MKTLKLSTEDKQGLRQQLLGWGVHPLFVATDERLHSGEEVLLVIRCGEHEVSTAAIVRSGLMVGESAGVMVGPASVGSQVLALGFATKL